jgi:hypothetical protein
LWREGRGREEEKEREREGGEREGEGGREGGKESWRRVRKREECLYTYHDMCAK